VDNITPEDEAHLLYLQERYRRVPTDENFTALCEFVVKLADGGGPKAFCGTAQVENTLRKREG
jgi:hypothetical protein|tara:strand:+ start:1799 stop:1987 length:189 start_codon:yes stop_codon:yes gene_type:complete